MEGGVTTNLEATMGVEVEGGLDDGDGDLLELEVSG